MPDDSFVLRDGEGNPHLVLLHDNADGTFSLATYGAAATALPSGDATIGRVGANATVIDLTPALDTGAYEAGDVLFICTVLADAVRTAGGQAQLLSIFLLDKDDAGGALDLLFFRTTQDIGAANAALALSDAEAVELLGYIRITAADYLDLGGQKVVCMKASDANFRVDLIEAGAASTSIFVAGVSQDAKTYSASGLLLKCNLVQA